MHPNQYITRLALFSAVVILIASLIVASAVQSNTQRRQKLDHTASAIYATNTQISIINQLTATARK